MAKPKADVELHAHQQAIRDAGLRATPSRIAVLSLLEEAPAPLSHAEVAVALRKNAWDRATLYRNLLDLARVGLARRKDMGDHIWRFERVRAQAHDTSHPHFVCTTCGRVSCMPGLGVAVRQRIGIPKAVQEREVEVEIRGLCDLCRGGMVVPQ
ncbi:MAG: transcriptional repressor [Deltaproteobacteria bacterium HGW-Deltaproteobacteria-20]|jgi:Fur family ferric uptake transcriptional regulator|nr:MAG: transcriptional repressor [Deltaproteobacteria bacterium HGW-Deltaproteobacteria-20]